MGDAVDVDGAPRHTDDVALRELREVIERGATDHAGRAEDDDSHVWGRSGSSRDRSASSSGRSGSPFAGRQYTGSVRHASRRSRCLSTFMLANLGSSSVTDTNDGTHFGPRSGCSARKASNAAGSNVGAVAQLHRDHDPIADRVVGHRVHGERAHVGMAADDRLDRCGGEVLTVDAQPLVRPAGEVQPAVGVSVGEVAGPVPAVAEAGLRGFLVLVVALEPVVGAVSTISPTASSRFVGRPSGPNLTGGHSSPVSGSITFSVGSALPSAPAGIDASRRMMMMPSVEP